MFDFIKKPARTAYEFVQTKAGEVTLVTGGTLLSLQAEAASVLDTSTTTQITSGFTDMKDTLLALLGVAWPFLIAVPVIMMAPRIVSKLVKMIGRG